MNPIQALALSRMNRLSGPLGIADRQMSVAYGVAGFGGSMILTRVLVNSKVSKPVAVAVPVVAAGVIALAVGLNNESSLILIAGSLIGSVLGVTL
jgi:hypothetical protein